MGWFGLACYVVGWARRPGAHEPLTGNFDIAYRDEIYLYQAAREIGLVVTPWWVFYQQLAGTNKNCDCYLLLAGHHLGLVG